MVKNLPAMWETRFSPWVGKIPWRSEWQPTPVFLPGNIHGQRSLGGYSPWDRKESDTTERLTHTYTRFILLLSLSHLNMVALILVLSSYFINCYSFFGFPGGASGKEPASQCGRLQKCEFQPWVQKIPWRTAWQPTPVFLPGESPWTEEPGGLQSVGLQRVRHDQSNLKHTDTYSFLEVKAVSGNHVDFFSEERGQVQNKQVLQMRNSVCELQKAFPTWHPHEGLG